MVAVAWGREWKVGRVRSVRIVFSFILVYRGPWNNQVLWKWSRISAMHVRLSNAHHPFQYSIIFSSRSQGGFFFLSLHLYRPPAASLPPRNTQDEHAGFHMCLKYALALTQPIIIYKQGSVREYSHWNYVQGVWYSSACNPKPYVHANKSQAMNMRLETILTHLYSSTFVLILACDSKLSANKRLLRNL